MQVSFVESAGMDTLLDADAPVWRKQRMQEIALMGTPAGMQPTAAIQVAWANKMIGAVGRVSVAALHNGREIAFRLEWVDATENSDIVDTDSFPDATAIALPVVPNAPIITMGAPGQAVNAWYWRADEPQSARQLSAEGLGTSQTFDTSQLRARGAWKEGRWRVVLARALSINSSAPAAQLSAGSATGFGIAVWDGANAERAGIKAFSGNWLPLQLEATATGRSA